MNLIGIFNEDKKEISDNMNLLTSLTQSFVNLVIDTKSQMDIALPVFHMTAMVCEMSSYTLGHRSFYLTMI
jgi:hypothetical protein